MSNHTVSLDYASFNIIKLSPGKKPQLDMMEANALQHESKTDIESVNCTFFITLQQYSKVYQ